MSTELWTELNETRTEQPEARAAAEVLPLPLVVDLIRRDSQRDSQQYLDETVVPFGGE